MNITRILLVGSDQVWSIERIYRKHLLSLGIDTELFAAQNFFYEYYNKHLFNKLLFKSGLSQIYQAINKNVLINARTYRPQVIWIFKGMELLPATLAQLRKEGFLLVNYNPDNPFYFSGSGSGNSNVTNSIGLYDIHFTYDREIQKRIISEYNLPCYILPFGFELSESLYEQCTRLEEIIACGFVGNPDKERVQFVEEIAEKIPVEVFGHGWDRMTKHSRIKIKGAVYGDDFWKVLHRYRVNLNLMRPHNPTSHNMRSFEIPGAGGVGLFPDTPDHRDFFEREGIAFIYNSVQDCGEQAAEILSMPSGHINKFRMKAREVSLANGYDYLNRTRQAVKLMQEDILEYKR